jgi:hypothetical protein
MDSRREFRGKHIYGNLQRVAAERQPQVFSMGCRANFIYEGLKQNTEDVMKQCAKK